MYQLQELKALIEQSQTFILTTHKKCDGDGIGSELALHRFLVRSGKHSHIVNSAPVIEPFQFLVTDGEVAVYDPREHDRLIRDADVVIALDIGHSSRLTEMKTIIEASRARRVLIDHHIGNDPFFDLFLCREHAAATGIIVYDLLREFGSEITESLAIPLYTAVSIDSGQFSYDRTKPETHYLAARLLEAGADPYKIYKETHFNRSLKELNLLGDVLTNLQLNSDGTVAWVVVTLLLLQKYTMDVLQLPSFIEYPLSLKGVEIALLFVELDEKTTKVSIRSKGNINIHDLASRFDGGGHRYAAGFILDQPIPEAREAVINATNRLVA